MKNFFKASLLAAALSIQAMPALAYLTPSAVLHHPAPACAGLECTVASTEFDLDATDAGSYGGSGQTWANLTLTPSSGATKTDYDVYLGADNTATTDDPFFNGSAGSSSAYWSFDGGDRFKQISAITTFLNNLHKSTGGQNFWVAVAFGSDGNWVNGSLVSTTTNCGTGTTVGVCLRPNTSEQLGFYQHYPSGNFNGVNPLTGFTAGDVYLAFYSMDITNNTLYYAKNTSTLSSQAFTYGTSTGSASGVLGIGGTSNGNLPIGSGDFKIYSVAMGTGVLDNTTAAAICSYYNSKHGRTYC